MEEIRIDYTRKHKRINLILGLVWIVFFAVDWILDDTPGWGRYGWLVIGITYIGIYLYQSRARYLSINADTIRVNAPWGKQMRISEIRTVRRFAGDYILKSQGRELVINTQIMAPESLDRLNAEIEKAGIPWS